MWLLCREGLFLSQPYMYLKSYILHIKIYTFVPISHVIEWTSVNMQLLLFSKYMSLDVGKSHKIVFIWGFLLLLLFLTMNCLWQPHTQRLLFLLKLRKNPICSTWALSNEILLGEHVRCVPQHWGRDRSQHTVTESFSRFCDFLWL